MVGHTIVSFTDRGLVKEYLVIILRKFPPVLHKKIIHLSVYQALVISVTVMNFLLFFFENSNSGLAGL